MAEAVLCPQCGKTVPTDAPQGLCPACVMSLGFDNEVAERRTIAPQAPARPGEETIAPPEGGFTTEPASGAAPSCAEVPGYEILGELGRGGMGVVYKARHKKLGRLVALKMILAGGHAGEAELARFRTEAEAIARLKHENIIQIYEIGEHEGKPYFSLEYCDGGSLADQINGTPMQPSDAARIVEKLARAMDAAHRQDVIHRDLKPANVLLAACGLADESSAKPQAAIPKITDFGLAKKLDEAGRTQDGSVMGTPSYMAPEQAGGKSKELGPACDIYALGAILYELLTGRPPFKAATPLDTVLQVVSDEPVSPSRLQPKLSPDLETICLKCLQKDPAKRYASSHELADDLQRFQAGEPIRARPVGGVERAMKWMKRRPAVAALFGVSAAAFVGFLASGGVMWHDAELRAETVKDLAQAKGLVAAQVALVGEKKKEVDELELLAKKAQAAADDARKSARRIRYAADMQFAHAALERNNLSRTLSLLERHRPTGAEEDLQGFEWHYLYRACHQERLLLNATTGLSPDFEIAQTPIVFAPDGKTLAAATFRKKPDVVDFDKTMRLWNVANGTETGAFPIPEFLLSLAYSADGLTLMGTTLNPDAFKNIGAEAAANAKNDTLIMMGKAKPTLKRLTGMYLVQSFSLDGKKRGGPEKFDPDRHANLIRQDGRIQSVSVKLNGQAFSATRAAESLDGKMMAVAGIRVPVNFAKPLAPPIPENAVLFWDVTKEEPITVFGAIKETITGVAFSPNGKTLAGTMAKTIYVWDVPTGKTLLTLPGHTATLSAMTFSHDGKIVASGTQDGVVKLWDAATGEELNTLKGHRTQVVSVVFAPDDNTLASVSSDGVIKLWDPRAPQGPKRFTLDKDIVQLVFAPDGKSLTAVTSAGTRLQWDMTAAGEKQLGGGGKGLYFTSAMSLDGKTLATAGFDRVVRLRDAETANVLRDLKGHKDTIFRLLFAPDSRVLATASLDRSVKLWDVGTGVERCVLPEWIASMAFSPDGKTLATGSADKTIKFWDVDSGKERRVLPAHPHQVNLLKFSVDGMRLAAGARDTVKVWDLATGKEVIVIHEPGRFFRAIALSSDGKRLATNSSRPGMTCEVKLWDADTGQEVLSLPLTLTASNAMHLVLEQQMVFNAQGTRLALAERIVDLLHVGAKRSEVTIWDATPVAAR